MLMLNEELTSERCILSPDTIQGLEQHTYGAQFEIQSHAELYPRFHSIEFGDGVVTKGAKAAHILEAEADIVFKHFQPGWSVLDVGRGTNSLVLSQASRGIPCNGHRPVFLGG